MGEQKEGQGERGKGEEIQSVEITHAARVSSSDLVDVVLL
jgi:hypothetical protein